MTVNSCKHHPTWVPTRAVMASAITLAAFMLILGRPAAAGKPEYMKLDLRPGVTLEVKGKMIDGTFLATDIETLEKKRRPKLRGSIESVDYGKGTLQLFGLQLHVTDQTEFVDESGKDFSFSDLAAKQRSEVSCKVKGGVWMVRRVTGGDIKSTDKIKATITAVRVDGVAPDTIEVSGLLITLDERTDVNLTEDEQSRLTQELLFGDLAESSAYGQGSGLLLADGRVFVGGEYRHNFRSESEFDLSRSFQSDREDTQPELRLEAKGYWSPHLRTFAKFRVRKKYNLSSDQNLPADDVEAHFVELYALAPNIRNSGLALQLGRQDFDEPREWLFDEYLDAVRGYYYGVNHLVLEAAVIHAVNPIKDKFDTWTDVLAMARWVGDKHNQASAYVLRRSDSDARNREPVWWGLRYVGRIRHLVRPWADLAAMRGEDRGESLRAWAVDVGATLRLRHMRFSPALTAGYAFATGDQNGADSTNQTFRQTAYQDNVARFGGTASVQYYGSVLDPELSNLIIWTLAAGIRPYPNSSVEVVYHTYRQDEADNKLRGSQLVDPPARPTGAGDDIGWALDVVVGLPKFWDHVRLTWTTGYFNPGDAFDLRQESAFLTKLNLVIDM